MSSRPDLVHHRVVCWARSSTPSSPMTACLCMDLTPSWSVQMTPRWSDSLTMMRLATEQRLSILPLGALTITCFLTTRKTKQLIVDFRKEKKETHDPIHSNGVPVECVSSFRFLGTHILEDLPWTITPPAWSRRSVSTSSYFLSLRKYDLSS